MDDTPFCPHCGARQQRAPRSVKARPNGTGTAYKRGKTWTAQVVLGYYEDENSKRKKIARTKGGFKTKTAALEYCAVLKNKEPEKTAPLLKHYWDVYSRTEMDSLSESKYRAYSIAWNKLKSIANTPIDKITVGTLREVVAKKAPTYYTARDIKILLSHLYKIAGADGVANKDLPSYIILPKLQEKERMPFTDEEQRLLWALYDAGDRNACIPLIMIATGMMPGEMRQLRTDMIDLEARTIIGAGLKTETRKKLSIVLPDDICPVLEEAMEGCDGLLYPISVPAFYDRYYAALTAAGITRRLTPYSCRHTTATRHTIDEHTPPQIVARLMRWKSTKMLDRYVHPSDEDAQVAANAMKRPQKSD